MRTELSRRAVIAALGGTGLVVGGSSASAAQTDGDAPIERVWSLSHATPRPDRTNDVVVTGDAVYLAGTVGAVGEMTARVLKTTPTGADRPEVVDDFRFADAIPVRLRVKSMVTRPDGRLDVAVPQAGDTATLVRVTPEGTIEDGTGLDGRNELSVGAVAPRDDGTTLVVGNRYGGTAAAVVQRDGGVDSFVDHDVNGEVTAGVARSDGGCQAAGSAGDAIQVQRVAPDGTVAGRTTVDVDGGVRRGVQAGGGALFAGRSTAVLNRGLVLSVAGDGTPRWRADLAADTVMLDVAPAGDGGAVAVGRHIPENAPWVARVTGDGTVAWQGRVPVDGEGELTGVHVDTEGRLTVAGTLVTDDGPATWLSLLRATTPTATPSSTRTATPTPTETRTPTPEATDTPTDAETKAATVTDPSPTEVSGPGLGAVAGVAGLFGGALAAWRRRGPE